METTALTNVIVALIILLIAAAVFIAVEMKALQAKIARLAYHLHFEVTRKADLLPQLLTRLTPFVDAADRQRLVVLRAKAMPLPIGAAEKKALEEDVWKQFAALWQKSRLNPDMGKDLLLLSLEKEIKEADDRIDRVRLVYNQSVSLYNRFAGNIVLKPLTLLIKARRLNGY